MKPETVLRRKALLAPAATDVVRTDPIVAETLRRSPPCSRIAAKR